MGSFPSISIRFDSLEQLQKVFDKTLSRGGAFAPDETGYSDGEELDLTLVHPVDGAKKTYRARAVWVVPEADGGGVGIAIMSFGPAVRDELAVWMEAHNKPPGSKRDGDKAQGSVHERLRNLSMVEQLKIARKGDVNERTVLERIYGKHVWEALVRNPRLSAPEVTRLVRMPGLPRHLVELIVGNPAWLSSPQVRHALLASRRLANDLMHTVLRATPKPELKLMERQTAYPPNVRAAAKNLLKS